MAKKENWRDLCRRARWDRIFGAVAVLLLLLILISSSISSCSKKEKKLKETSNILETMPDTTQQPTTEKEEEHPNAIYLSPSTQEHNIYACDETVSEEKAMWMIARQVKSMLEEDGYEVFICGEDDTVPDKVILGNKLKCGAYIAIHSNSSGENGNGEGTECFYNTNIPGSMALAEMVYNRVAEVTPTRDRGIKDETQRDLYEINNNITPCCFLEVEFHDKPKTSSWILNHVEDLAQAITEGLESYMETSQYIPRMDVTEPTINEDDTYIDY